MSYTEVRGSLKWLECSVCDGRSRVKDERDENTKESLRQTAGATGKGERPVKRCHSKFEGDLRMVDRRWKKKDEDRGQWGEMAEKVYRPAEPLYVYTSFLWNPKFNNFRFVI